MPRRSRRWHPRRPRKKSRQGKFSTRHASKLGRPSRGLASSRYQYAPRVATQIANIKDGPFPAQWNANGTLTATAHWGVFQLDDVPDHANFQALYEAYRINAIKVEFIPVATITTAVTADQMIAWNFFDPSGNYGSANFPTQAALLEMQRCRKRPVIGGKPMQVYSKLKQANVVLKDSVLTYAYTQQKPRWISTTQPAVNHYGLVTIFTNQNGLVLPTDAMQMITTYYLEFKGVK